MLKPKIQQSKRMVYLAQKMSQVVVVLVLVGGLTNLAFAQTPPCDATTGATARVMGITTTTTGATISWREGHTNGGRFWCFGTDSAKTCKAAQLRTGGAKNEVVADLIPNTVYKYRCYGVWGTGQKSIVSGTFKTDGGACIMPQDAVMSGVVLSAAKTPLEFVEVKAYNPKLTPKLLVGIDTTDAMGKYSISVSAEANYELNYSYSPFIAPAVATKWVMIQLPNVFPEKLMTGAFQIGGTILGGAAGKDSIMGATITVAQKTGGAVVGARKTDAKGHFNIGLVAGNYEVAASYGGVTVSQIPLTVSADAQMPAIKLNGTVGLKSRVDKKIKKDLGFNSPSYRINGAQVKTHKNFESVGLLKR